MGGAAVEDVAAMIMGGIQQHVTLPEGDMDELKEESDEKVKGNETRISNILIYCR